MICAFSLIWLRFRIGSSEKKSWIGRSSVKLYIDFDSNVMSEIIKEICCFFSKLINPVSVESGKADRCLKEISFKVSIQCLFGKYLFRFWWFVQDDKTSLVLLVHLRFSGARGNLLGWIGILVLVFLNSFGENVS